MSRLYEALRNAKAAAEPPASARLPPTVAGHLSPTDASAVRLYHAIEARLPGRSSRIVLVMGCGQGAGASTVAMNTARMASVAAGRRVLLLNTADPVPPHLRLSGRSRSDGDDGMDVRGDENGPPRLFMGALPHEGINLAAVNQDKLRAYWDRLREQLDLVIIDAPPPYASPVGLALAPTADGVVLVLEAERTRASAAAAARDAIRSTGANLLGVVLNKRRYHVPRFLYDQL